MIQKSQLLQVKQKVQNFFLKSRYNIGLTKMLEIKELSHVTKELEKALEDQSLFYAKFERINSIIGINKIEDIQDELLLLNLEEQWKPLSEFFEKEDMFLLLLFIANKTGSYLLESQSIDKEFKLTDKVFIDNLRARVEESYTYIDKTTQKIIVKIIDEDLKKGMSMMEIAKDVRDKMKNISEYRAGLITEYEVSIIYAQLVAEFYKRSGVERHRWITSYDEMVCDVCVGNERDGSIPIGQSFRSGITTPPAHQNCRCFTIPDGEVDDVWLGN